MMATPALAVTLMLTACGSVAGEALARSGAEAAAPTESAGGDDHSDSNAQPRYTHPAECLHGTWQADNEFFLASIREFGDEVTDVSGVVEVHFAQAGTLTTHYREWRITATTEGVTATILREGVDEGTFEVNDRMIDLADTQIGSRITLSGEGMEMTIEPEPVHFMAAELECAPTSARIVTPTGTLLLSR